MICFGYPKLTFNISMAFILHDCRLWICARANFARAFLRRWFDNTVLLKQSAYRNRGLFLGRYCDVLLYNAFYHTLQWALDVQLEILIFVWPTYSLSPFAYCKDITVIIKIVTIWKECESEEYCARLFF